jgi:hypothetical protein
MIGGQAWYSDWKSYGPGKLVFKVRHSTLKLQAACCGQAELLTLVLFETLLLMSLLLP